MLELGLLGSSAAEGCCCPAPHPVLLTSLDPAASSNSGVVCRSCGRTPRRPSATLGLLFGTVVEPSRGDVSFCHVCARGTGQPDTAVGQCLDQEQKAHAGLIMFCSIVKTLLLLRNRAVHARARCMAVAHATPRARTWVSYPTVHHAPPRGIFCRCRSSCRASTHPYFSEGEHLSVARRVPVCAGSCALACAGASGEQRGPWSGRLLSYLCGFVYFFGVVVWFHVFSTRSNFQL